MTLRYNGKSLQRSLGGGPHGEGPRGRSDVVDSSGTLVVSAPQRERLALALDVAAAAQTYIQLRPREYTRDTVLDVLADLRRPPFDLANIIHALWYDTVALLGYSYAPICDAGSENLISRRKSGEKSNCSKNTWAIRWSECCPVCAILSSILEYCWET